MFGKIMSIADDVMWEYFRLLTDINIDKIKMMHPKKAKLLLAENITSFYHSLKIARREKNEFEKVFSRKKIPQDIPVYRADKSSIDVVDVIYEAKLLSSKNEIRRLLKQGGVYKVENSGYVSLKEQIVEMASDDVVLKIGKKKFLKIVCA